MTAREAFRRSSRSLLAFSPSRTSDITRPHPIPTLPWTADIQAASRSSRRIGGAGTSIFSFGFRFVVARCQAPQNLHR